MSVTLTYPTKQTGYYLFNPLKTIFIIADGPDAQELMKRAPHIPAVNQVALDLIFELVQGKATAEGKVALLKKAIESL
jgi:hypothetical protein